MEVFELNPTLDDPRLEGFALVRSVSNLGRDSLDDDLTPGFGDAEENPRWQQPKLASSWIPPQVTGRVAEYHDYPCIDLVLPAFSERAVRALKPMLEPNGELLPIVAKTTTRFFFYNILTVVDALDRSRSKCKFWCDPPTTATNIEYFTFVEEKVRSLTIFRIHESPISVFVTSKFVERVDSYGLLGFRFVKVWPLPEGTNWRMQTKERDREERLRLKRQTLIVVLPMDGVDNALDRICSLANAVDYHLQLKEFTDPYLGSYEGHDIVGSEYRMFFSAPNTNILFESLRALLCSLRWNKSVRVYLREGGMFDEDAREEVKIV